LLDTLNQIVRGAKEFQSGEQAGRLVKIPTRAGMALVFYNSPEHRGYRAAKSGALGIEETKLLDTREPTSQGSPLIRKELSRSGVRQAAGQPLR